MRLDNSLMLSDAQAITASAASTSHRDNGAAMQAIAHPLVWEFLVDTLFESSGASTMTIAIQGDSDSAFGTAVNIVVTAAIPKASLTVGAKFRLIIPSGTPYRYLRAYYTVATANFTAGKMDAFPVQTVQQGIS